MRKLAEIGGTIVVTIVILFLLWAFVLPSDKVKVAALEAQIALLKAAPTPPALTPDQQRIAELEKKLVDLKASPPPPPAPVLTQADVDKAVNEAVAKLQPPPAPAPQAGVQAPPAVASGGPRVYTNAEIAKLAGEATQKVGPATGGFYTSESTDQSPPGRTGCVVIKTTKAADGGTFQQWQCPRGVAPPTGSVPN